MGLCNSNNKFNNNIYLHIKISNWIVKNHNDLYCIKKNNKLEYAKHHCVVN